jgi:hypothetical protein
VRRNLTGTFYPDCNWDRSRYFDLDLNCIQSDVERLLNIQTSEEHLVLLC